MKLVLPNMPIPIPIDKDSRETAWLLAQSTATVPTGIDDGLADAVPGVPCSLTPWVSSPPVAASRALAPCTTTSAIRPLRHRAAASIVYTSSSGHVDTAPFTPGPASDDCIIVYPFIGPTWKGRSQWVTAGKAGDPDAVMYVEEEDTGSDGEEMKNDGTGDVVNSAPPS